MPSRKRPASVHKWEREHRRTVGAQLSTEEAEAVKLYAKRHGLTVSALIKKLIREELEKENN